MAVPRVHFVVCTRNNRDVVCATLRSVAGQTVQDHACTVVDGLSSDGTPGFIREEFPFAEVIVKDSDSGPAASRNIGISRARAELVVFLDSDVELRPDWTARQIRFMEREGADIACGKLVHADRPDLIQSSYGAMNRLGVAWDGGGGRPAAEFRTVRRCLWSISAAMAARRSVLEALGGFDEAMFAFHEDCDLGWRANLFGYRVASNPEAVALHRSHSTMNPGTMGSRITHLVHRNRLRSALVNYERGNVLRYVSLYALLAAADALRRGPRPAKLAALWWNLKRLPDTLRRRRFVQERRAVRDRDLWSLFEPGWRGPGATYR